MSDLMGKTESGLKSGSRSNSGLIEIFNIDK